ncbi:MAG: type III pantothenate kinase [Clostridia bacterium]
MLLVLDIGNTNIKTGLFRNGVLIYSWRLATNMSRTSDEYGVQMESFFGHLGLETAEVTGIIMSSVIPSMNYTIERMCEIYFHHLPVMLVSPKLNLGINISYDYPDQLGTDRICNSVAAYRTYGGPCIAVDFGTATNFCVISEQGKFMGGLICPGLMISADALIDKTAMLHKVEYIKPRNVVCTNTKDAIQAGVIYGYVGQVDYIIGQIERESKMDFKVIATGGMSGMIASETNTIDTVNPTLTLEGLAMIYELNA